MDIADVLARKQPRRQHVTIVLDAELELDLADARAAVEAARARAAVPSLHPNAVQELGKAQVELDRLTDLARDASVTFVFQALGRQQFSDLRGGYPPTKEQRTDWKARWLKRGMAEHQIPELEHNVDTFPPVLIAASCIAPEMTLEDATTLWSSAGWSDSELAELMGAALFVNTDHRRHDLGNASR